MFVACLLSGRAVVLPCRGLPLSNFVGPTFLEGQPLTFSRATQLLSPDDVTDLGLLSKLRNEVVSHIATDDTGAIIAFFTEVDTSFDPQGTHPDALCVFWDALVVSEPTRVMRHVSASRRKAGTTMCA